jgi:hypothetical protein
MQKGLFGIEAAKTARDKKKTIAQWWDSYGDENYKGLQSEF